MPEGSDRDQKHNHCLLISMLQVHIQIDTTSDSLSVEQWLSQLDHGYHQQLREFIAQEIVGVFDEQILDGHEEVAKVFLEVQKLVAPFG